MTGSEMNWTCPACKSRNATSIAPDAEAGKIVDVRCAECEAAHRASVFFPAPRGGAPLTIGIVWI